MVKWICVTLMTLARIPLSLLFCYFVLFHHRPALPCVLLFAVIALLDFCDGKAARRYGMETAAGAVLDVTADCFFIVSAGFVLCLRGLYPGWMLALVLLKFLEFCLTSHWTRREAGVFLFDPLGRAVAVAFYLLPPVILLLSAVLPAVAATVILIFCLAIAAAALLSSAFRIASVCKRRFRC